MLLFLTGSVEQSAFVIGVRRYLRVGTQRVLLGAPWDILQSRSPGGFKEQLALRHDPFFCIFEDLFVMFPFTREHLMFSSDTKSH